MSRYLNDFADDYGSVVTVWLLIDDPLYVRYNLEELEELVSRLKEQAWALESMIPPDMHIMKNKYISEELRKIEDEALAIISDMNKLDNKSYFVEVMVRDEMMERKQRGHGSSEFDNDAKGQDKTQRPAVYAKFSSRGSLRPTRFIGYVEHAADEEDTLSTPFDRAQMSVHRMYEGQVESKPKEPKIARTDDEVGENKFNASKIHGELKKEGMQPAKIDDKLSAPRNFYEHKHGRPEGSTERLTTWQNLAIICRSEKNWNEARHWGYQMMHASEKIFGPYDPRTIASMLDLISTINQLSHRPQFVEDAEWLESQVQERVTKLLQIEAPTTLTGMGDLALTYRSYKQWHMARLIEAYLIKQGETLIQDDLLADLLFNDLSLRKTYQANYKKFGAERLAFHHDVVLAEFIERIDLEESANRGLIQAVHLTQDEPRRKRVTGRIIYHIQKSMDPSKYGGKAEIVQERLLDFRPSLTVVTQSRAFLNLQSALEDVTSIPWTIKEALDHGDIELLQHVLEARFDVVAQDDYSWLQELIDVGYTYRELAELLLEQSSDAPWIFFEPRSFDEQIEISFDTHIQGCVHEFYKIEQSAGVSSTSPVIKSSPTTWKNITRTLEELCGLAGVIPYDRDRSEWTGSVQFAQQNTVATVTCSELSDAPDSENDVSLSVYIERIKKSLTNFCLAAAHAQAAGLCCESFTILRIGSESSLKLERIRFGFAEEMLHNLGNVSGEDLYYGYIQRIAARILDPFTENGLHYNNNYDILDALERCSLATQFLCLGFLSYIQAHAGPLRPFFLDTPLQKVQLLGLGLSTHDLRKSTSAYNFTIEASLKQLTCLDGMIQSKVFVFETISSRSESTSRPIQEPRQQVPLEHGQSPEDMPRVTIDRSTVMIIGTPVVINGRCILDSEECRKRSSAFLEPMGTYRTFWYHDERQIGIQGGQYAVVQAIAAAHKMPGRNLKQHIIEQDEKMLVSFMNELWGVQVSFCTHVARRVPLRELVADLLPALAAVSSSSRDALSWEQLKQLDIIDAFQKDEVFKWLAKLPEPLHKEVLKMIRVLLEILQHTGLDREKKNLVVAWPHEGGMFKCFKVPLEKQTSWAGVLADSEDSAAFCYITTRCFETGKIKCSGPSPTWSSEIPLLETAVMPHAKDRSALAAALQHDKAYYFQKMDDLFFVRVQRPVSSGVANLITKRSIIPRSMQIRLFARNGARLRERVAQGEFAEEVAVSYSPISSS
ncbi:hypothetical protein GRF29_216g1152689 [Pseudopithomyces chartarum]|uniref:Uncharacterized protein n=1 Tax=Pseudopithomyces chartarum TaxID=1892770 RepID=A0AAN6LLY5_9PLEO|nr:hypothetical protein GRF29_216g1152689 [Pseudopithomyces chartarum]